MAHLAPRDWQPRGHKGWQGTRGLVVALATKTRACPRAFPGLQGSSKTKSETEGLSEGKGYAEGADKNI